MTFVSSKLVARIKKYREQKNYAQHYVAEGLGISQKAYSKIETGETKLSVEHLLKISVLLEVDILQLLDTDSINTYNNNIIETITIDTLYKSIAALYEKLLAAKDVEIGMLREKLQGKN